MITKAKKTYGITDCFKNSKEKTGVYVKENEIVSGYAPEKTEERITDSLPEKVYLINGNAIVYCKDGFLRTKDKGGYKKLTPVPFDGAPVIFQALNGGKTCAAVKKSNGIMLISDKTDYVKCEDGDFYYPFLGRTFIAKDNVIKIIDEYDFYNGNEEKDVRIIVLSEDFGKVIALSSYKDALLIVCKKKIITLSFDGDGLYSLKNMESAEINVVENTVKKVGDKVYFLSDGTLYCVSDKVEECLSSLKDEAFTVNYQAFYYNGCYFLPILKGGKELLYVKDAEKGCDYFIKADDLLFCDGGYGFNKENGYLYRLKKDCDGYREIVSEKTDFKYADKKHLVGLNAYSEYPVSLKIAGDFGEREFSFSGEEIRLKCNLYSGRFTFTFFSETKMKISDVKIIVG